MVTALDKTFWDTRWQTGETHWDLGTVSPPIKEYIDHLTNKDLKILIPGCGSGYEGEYLVEQGFNHVTIVDISPTAVLEMKSRLTPEVNQHLNVVEGDFFAIEEQYDLVLEQTFFCALEPSMRKDYVKKMSEIIKPGGKLVGVLFNREFEKEGPPFGGSKPSYINLFEPYFIINTMEECYNSAGPRAGTELFINLTVK